MKKVTWGEETILAEKAIKKILKRKLPFEKTLLCIYLQGKIDGVEAIKQLDVDIFKLKYYR